MPPDPNRVETLFNAALTLAPPERPAFLVGECANDSELRARIEKLLAAHADLEAPPGTAAHAPDRPTATFGDAGAPEGHSPPPDTGTVIGGKYKLVEAIGEGGMGSVWMACQTEPVKRTVAVKLIKAGMDSKAVLARFEAERQALALMDHPNIAKVLDAGTAPDGRPFFVMELVKGVPITKYCDEQKLTPRQRLELFVPVCQAIQHAHQKGIIHRDIKPSNVLIARYDDRPVPKVIDFGVAKAAGQPLTDKTLTTGFGAVVGTPEYMSPEQASFNNLDIDTRSDVYALGVMLYELLAGGPPFSRTELEKVGLLEIFRVIREQEPPRPSTKLSTADALPTLSANRGTEPKTLTRLLRGELDWIVMRALEKDRNRRYETANGLARDVQRYLADEVVEARPPSTGYRLRKFVRRNKGRVVAASLVVLALVAGVIGTSAGLVWANAERKRAVAAEADAVTQADAARKHAEYAEANARKAMGVVDEYFTLTSESKLLDVPGLQPLRKDLLESALRFHEQNVLERPNDPRALADLAVTRVRLGEVYHTLDRNDEAVALLHGTVALVERLLRDHPDARESHLRLAGFWKGWRRDFHWTVVPNDSHAAVQSLTRLAGLWNDLGNRYPEGVGFRSDEAAINLHIGEMFAAMQHHEKSVLYYSLAHGILERLVREYPSGVDYRADLGLVSLHIAESLRTKQRAEATKRAKEGFAVLEQLAREYPTAPRHRTDFAGAHIQFGQALAAEQPREAEAHFRSALELLRTLDREFPGTRLYLHRMTVVLVALIGFAGSDANLTELENVCRPLITYLERLVADQNRRLDRDKLADLYHRFAILLGKRPDRAAEAEQFHRKALALFEQLSKDFPSFAWYAEMQYHLHRWLAGGLQRAGNLKDAEAHYRRAIAIISQPLPPGALEPATPREHQLANTQRVLGDLLLSQKRYPEAETLLLEAYEGLKQHDKIIPPHGLREIASTLVKVYVATGKKDQAEKLYRTAVSEAERLVAANPKSRGDRESLAAAYSDFGAFLTNQLGQPTEAEDAHRKSLEVYQDLAKDYPTAAGYVNRQGHQHHWVASMQWRQGKLADAEASYKNAIALFATTTPPDDPGAGIPRDYWRAESLYFLGALLFDQSKYPDAEQPLLAAYDGMRRHSKVMPAGHGPRLLEVAIRLARMYSALGKPDEAKKWRAERDKYTIPVAPMPREVKR